MDFEGVEDEETPQVTAPEVTPTQVSKACRWYKPYDANEEEEYVNQRAVTVVSLENAADELRSAASENDAKQAKKVLQFLVNHRRPEGESQEEEYNEARTEVLEIAHGMVNRYKELMRGNARRRDADIRTQLGNITKNDVEELDEEVESLENKTFGNRDEGKDDEAEEECHPSVRAAEEIRKLVSRSSVKLVAAQYTKLRRNPDRYIALIAKNLTFLAHSNSITDTHLSPNTFFRALDMLKEIVEDLRDPPKPPAITTTETQADSREATAARWLNTQRFGRTNVAGHVEVLYRELRRMSQNIEDDYMDCIEAECSLLAFSYDLINDKIFGDSLRGTVSSQMLQVLCHRTKQIESLLEERFPSLKRPFDVDALWQVARQKSTDERALVKLHYCYNKIIHGDVVAARSVLLAEKMNPTHNLLGPSREGEHVISDALSVHCKIMFDRIIVQLGMTHFSHGEVDEALMALTSLCEEPDLDVLLGQRIPQHMDRNADAQTKAAHLMKFRQLLIPPHYRIPTEEIRYVYLTSAVLADKKKKYLADEQTQLENLVRRIKANSYLAGDAQLPDDHLFGLYKGIEDGDASDVKAHLLGLPIWARTSEEAKNSIITRARELCFKTFLQSEAERYDSVTIDYIKKRFNLGDDTVRRVFNEAIRSGALVGFWINNDEAISLERGSAGSLHRLAEDVARQVDELGNRPQRSVTNRLPTFRRK